MNEQTTEMLLAEIKAEFTTTEEIFAELSVDLDWETKPISISFILRDHFLAETVFKAANVVTFNKKAA